MEKSAFSHCGSLLAASSHKISRTGDNPVNLTLLDMKTMKVVQTIALDDCLPGFNHKLVFSSDGKTLVFDSGYSSEIMFFQVHDLHITRRRLGHDPGLPRNSLAIAYDSTSQVVASAGVNCNYIRLWTL